jgi:type VI secretion system ImpB/VipA family protein
MGSSQKFIARNRAPRVRSNTTSSCMAPEKKVQLPFVMGVMSDLSGKSEEPLPPVSDRKFLEVDVDNFDARMKSMKPRGRVRRSRTRSPAKATCRSTSPSRAWTTSRPPRWRARSRV